MHAASGSACHMRHGASRTQRVNVRHRSREIVRRRIRRVRCIHPAHPPPLRAAPERRTRHLTGMLTHARRRRSRRVSESGAARSAARERRIMMFRRAACPSVGKARAGAARHLPPASRLAATLLETTRARRQSTDRGPRVPALDKGRARERVSEGRAKGERGRARMRGRRRVGSRERSAGRPHHGATRTSFCIDCHLVSDAISRCSSSARLE